MAGDFDEMRRLVGAEVFSISTFGSLAVDGGKWWGGVLASNGKIYCIPYLINTILNTHDNTLGGLFKLLQGAR